MALNKATIIEEVAARLSLTPSKAKHATESLLETMKSTLSSGEDLMVSGVGRFQVNDKAPRKGRNPATGGTMTLKKRKTVTFKCCGKLRDQINGNHHE